MNRLSDERREEIVFRLLQGETVLSIRGQLLKIVIPDPRIRLLANNIFTSTLHKQRFNKDWISDKEIVGLLVKNNLCTPDIDRNLVEIQKSIDDIKVEAYKSIMSPDHEKIRKRLNIVRSKYQEMLNTRHMFDYLTVRGYAEMIKRQFILCHTVYDYNTNKRLWDNMADLDVNILDSIAMESNKLTISAEDLREIARTEPWKGHWAVSGGKPFPISSTSLSEEQKTVVLFSYMYENVLKHPECPPDSVIEDDDLFDGWMIIQRREREKEQMSKQIEKKVGQAAQGAGEVFLPAQTPEQAKAIFDLNDVSGQITIKQRERQIAKQGKVEDSKLLDRRLEMQQESNALFMKTVKGK